MARFLRRLRTALWPDRRRTISRERPHPRRAGRILFGVPPLDPAIVGGAAALFKKDRSAGPVRSAFDVVIGYRPAPDGRVAAFGSANATYSPE
jgi:hypothetical protein